MIVRERMMQRIKTTYLSILPLIVIVLGIGASPRQEACSISALQVTKNALGKALELYRVETGTYPTEAQGLSALLAGSGEEDWRRPFLRATRDNLPPPDPWDNQLRYRLVDGKPQLDSAGADGIFGTADDNKQQRSRTMGCSRTR